MNIIEILSRSGNARIFFHDTTSTFSDIKKHIGASNVNGMPVFKWAGQWGPQALQDLLTAFLRNLPIVCSSDETDTLPPLKPGEVAFRSSGSEGKIKWAIHPHKHFLEGPLLNFKGPALALLSPSHAAGFDFLFLCLRAGSDFGFTDLKNLKFPEVRTIFGPPQAMAGLLFFHKNNGLLLNQLEEYFVSSDPLPPILLDKAKKLNLPIKFRIFYGSSETMVIKVNEHPDHPHLFKFVPGEAKVTQGEVFYEGPTLATKIWTEEKGIVEISRPFPLGDIVQEENGWLSLHQNKRNLIKIWGNSLNLKMLEDDILSLQEVIDTRVEVVTSDLFGSQITIHIWSKINPAEDDLFSLPQLSQLKGFCKIEFHAPDEINIQKKKRITDGKKD